MKYLKYREFLRKNREVLIEMDDSVYEVVGEKGEIKFYITKDGRHFNKSGL